MLVTAFGLGGGDLGARGTWLCVDRGCALIVVARGACLYFAFDRGCAWDVASC
jgi:hypothetical protein